MIAEIKLWGTLVGYLSDDAENNIHFTYDPSFVSRGVEISPITLKIRREPYSFPRLTSDTFRRLPGLFADSLPDKFGRRVINEYLLSIGRDKNSLTPIEELLYIGSRGMGALEYHPHLDDTLSESSEIRIEDIANAAKDVLKRRSDAATKPEIGRLRELIKIGSSAGGAKAKAIIAYNEETGVYRSGQIDAGNGFTYWIIKFDKLDKEDLNSFFDSYQTREEYAYYLMAKAAGIDMAESRLLQESGDYHFMTKRFDREGNRRLHVQTLCALQHLPVGSPRELCTYDALFDTAEAIGLKYEEREELFRRMAFNVYNREMDDHTKNFSFLMTEDGTWHLAPAYDLTGCHFSAADAQFDDWQNQHALSVNGKFSGIGDDDLLAVAEKYAIGTAPNVLSRIRDVFDQRKDILPSRHEPEKKVGAQ